MVFAKTMKNILAEISPRNEYCDCHEMNRFQAKAPRVLLFLVVPTTRVRCGWFSKEQRGRTSECRTPFPDQHPPGLKRTVWPTSSPNPPRPPLKGNPGNPRAKLFEDIFVIFSKEGIVLEDMFGIDMGHSRDMQRM